MSNKSGLFRKYFWDSFVLKILWKDLWIINVLVGVFAAIVIPNILPLQGLSSILNELVYGVIFLFITEFIKIVLTIQRKIKTELETYRTDLKKSLDDLQEKVGITYYTGFYTLLTNLSKEFENMEKGLTTVTGGESPFRGVLLDFIVNSLASIGRSGFTMVDATVTDYVKYITQVVQKSSQITMTCVVRPYWFVVDEIQGVTLPPYIGGSNKYGKGEHLRCFGKESTAPATRYLIVDELMLADMILTAYIDKYIFGIGNECHICQKDSNKCPFHNDRIKLSESINDIPEIVWFDKFVNEDRGVTLIYTLIPYERRKTHVELDDRVYISNPTPHMDIRFEFANLEKGTLRIRWGEQAMPLASIGTFSTRVDPKTGNEDSSKGHTFYKTFSGIIRKDHNVAIERHLELLEREVQEYFNEKNIQEIRGIHSTEIIELLANGSPKFKDIIVNAISKLRNKLKSDLNPPIYTELVEFYNTNGVAKVAYIVTHDLANPKYPVRVARWKFNWDGDENSKEGILNAPD